MNEHTNIANAYQHTTHKQTNQPANTNTKTNTNETKTYNTAQTIIMAHSRFYWDIFFAASISNDMLKYIFGFSYFE